MLLPGGGATDIVLGADASWVKAGYGLTHQPTFYGVSWMVFWGTMLSPIHKNLQFGHKNEDTSKTRFSHSMADKAL